MRLTEDQCAGIVRALGNSIRGCAVLYLYGSRVHDHLRGGDIDLLLIAEPQLAEKLNAEHHHILAHIKREIGDQRIDLTIATEGEAGTETFLVEAMRKGTELHRWC